MISTTDIRNGNLIAFWDELSPFRLYLELKRGKKVVFSGHTMTTEINSPTDTVLWVTNPYGLDYPMWPFDINLCKSIAETLSSGESIGLLAE